MATNPYRFIVSNDVVFDIDDAVIAGVKRRWASDTGHSADDLDSDFILQKIFVEIFIHRRSIEQIADGVFNPDQARWRTMTGWNITTIDDTTKCLIAGCTDRAKYAARDLLIGGINTGCCEAHALILAGSLEGLTLIHNEGQNG